MDNTETFGDSTITIKKQNEQKKKRAKKKWSFFSCCIDSREEEDEEDSINFQQQQQRRSVRIDRIKSSSKRGIQAINTETQNSNSLSNYDNTLTILLKNETNRQSHDNEGSSPIKDQQYHVHVDSQPSDPAKKLKSLSQISTPRVATAAGQSTTTTTTTATIAKSKFNAKTFFQSRNAQDNEISHLYSRKNPSKYILIKYKEKNFAGTSGISSNTSSFLFDQSAVAAATTKGYRSDFDSQFNAIPDQICIHIASRLRNLFVVDAFVGVGYNSIQFAKEALQVLGVDIDQIKLNHAKYNIELMKAQSKIEIISADFLSLKRIKADVVVLHPDYKQCDQCMQSCEDDAIHLECDIKPNLVQALKQAFKIAESVILILNRKCDLSSLPDILTQVPYSDKKFGIEIELLHVQRQFSNSIVYLGPIADIHKNEEVEFYVEKLFRSTNSRNEHFKSKLRLALIHLRDKIKIIGVSELIESCEAIVNSEQTRSTLFQIFWDRISERPEKPRINRIRSSGNLQFSETTTTQDISTTNYSGSTDTVLRQLICEINEILSKNITSNYQYNKGSVHLQFQHGTKSSKDQHLKSEPKNQIPQSIDTNSLNSQSFQTNGVAMTPSFEQEDISNLKKKNIKFNMSLQYESDQKPLLSALSGTQKGFLKSSLNGQQNQLQQRSEQQPTQRKSALKNPIDTDSHTSQAEHIAESLLKPTDQNKSQLSQQQQQSQQFSDHSYQYEDNDEDDYRDHDDQYSPKIVYSCSYNTNTLVDSELSESNSLRPQQSNNYYGVVGSSDFYEDPSIVSGVRSSSISSNSVQQKFGQSFISKSGKKNTKGFDYLDRSYSADQQKIAQLRQFYSAKNNEEQQDADFYWTYEEDQDDEKGNNNQQNYRYPKTKNNNTYTNTQFDDNSPNDKKEIYTLPNSLS